MHRVTMCGFSLFICACMCFCMLVRFRSLLACASIQAFMSLCPSVCPSLRPSTRRYPQCMFMHLVCLHYVNVVLCAWANCMCVCVSAQSYIAVPSYHRMCVACAASHVVMFIVACIAKTSLSMVAQPGCYLRSHGSPRRPATAAYP